MPRNIAAINGCVRLGNLDFDVENLNPDFPIEREIRKRISPQRSPSSGGFQLRNPNPNFLMHCIISTR